MSVSFGGKMQRWWILRRTAGGRYPLLSFSSVISRWSPFLFSSFSTSSSLSSVSAAASACVAADSAVVLPSPPPSSKVEFIPTLLQPRVVIYDGCCCLCHDGVKWVINADKYQKIKFCCLQSKAADPYMVFAGLDREDVRRQFLFVEGPDSYYQGSTAALKVASYLPLPYQALSALLIIPAPLRDLVYGYDARRHYNKVKEEEDCIAMRDKDVLHRFIDRDEILAKENAKARHL